MSNKNKDLMNATMYDALRNAGIKEKAARAAATEAGRHDLRSITLEYALTELRSHVDTSMAELRSHVGTSMTELRSHVDTSHAALLTQIEKTHTHIEKTARNNMLAILTAIGVAVAILAFIN